jgi:hypothetical protein
MSYRYYIDHNLSCCFVEHSGHYHGAEAANQYMELIQKKELSKQLHIIRYLNHVESADLLDSDNALMALRNCQFERQVMWTGFDVIILEKNNASYENLHKRFKQASRHFFNTKIFDNEYDARQFLEIPSDYVVNF